MIRIAIKKPGQLLKKAFYVFCAALILNTAMPLTGGGMVMAMMDPDAISDYYSENDVLYYDPTACGVASSAAASFTGVDKFLQVLAYQESGGKPDGPDSGTGAKGKYQYIDSTWQGVIKGNKLPWTQYKVGKFPPTPEEVQDAVAFIEYSKKFKKFNNDIFKLAVSHFYPLANDKPALLDVVPRGNVITPRQYAKQIESRVNNEGPWSKIQLKYKDAPDFAKAAAANGIDLNTSNPGGGATGNANNLQYIPVGTGPNAIPVTGKKVGASVYGGSWTGSQWKSSNDVENPGQKNDDTGYGNRNNKLPGSTAYAELSTNTSGTLDFSALGNLPNGQKLAITYNGRTVIAQKGDVGAGGDKVEGKPRAIDLFYDVARLLEFKNGLGVVTVHGVSPDTALTPTGGTALSDAGGAAFENACNAPCDGQATGDIVLDPGHSDPDKQGEKDPETQLRVGDNGGAPGELEGMMKAANKVKKDLETAGYKVIMTKSQAHEYVDLRKRAEIANRAKAALAVSFHYDDSPGHQFNNWGQIYPQEVGLHRYNGDKHHPENEKIFNLPDVAKKSQAAAKIFQEERAKVEGHKAEITHANFDTRGSLYSPGNIPHVQLFATVPWVYNEVGAGNFNADKYADGITAAIKRVVKPSGAAGAAAEAGQAAACDGAAAGDIIQTAINYAWPTHDEGFTKPPREGYKAAIDKFNLPDKSGKDCGEFVAAVMLGSGADPKYPHIGTFIQEPYLRKSGKYDIEDEAKSSSQVAPGDILVVNAGSGAGSSGHTLIFVGKGSNVPKGYNAASASFGKRTGSMSTWTPGPDELGRGYYTRARKVR